MSEVTVVIPSRGRPEYLADAVASALAEGPADVIVVEDGTRRVGGETVFGARLIQLRYVGRAAARNAGAESASTPYVAFLDADDLALPGRLERGLEALADAPDAVLAFGRVEAVGPDCEQLAEQTEAEGDRVDMLIARGFSYESVLKDCPIYTSATIVRRERFLAEGGYDLRLDGYEDLDLYLRLARQGGLALCAGGPVARHRRHAANTPSGHLYACMLRLADVHLSELELSAEARRALHERRVDALWGLGDFEGARRAARRAARTDPALLSQPRFVKRLGGSALPVGTLRALRARRS
jgi:GT2 family glycosyltransferase